LTDESFLSVKDGVAALISHGGNYILWSFLSEKRKAIILTGRLRPV
jgi:hypothetical protein